MAFKPNLPHNELPLLPPKSDIETKAIFRKCIAANKALAELKGMGDIIPNQAILINAIPLQEAKLSSEIENIITTNDQLYRAALNEEAEHDSTTKEVLQYRKALRYGFEELKQRPISENLIKTICGMVRNQDIQVRKVPGISIINQQRQETVYTPPIGEDLINKLLANLFQFLYKDDKIDPLIKLAVGHYQFEAIHPFSDGNGRTGRILNILYLLEKKLLHIPVLYHSRYIIEHKNEYYSHLAAVTQHQQWEEWILYMLSAIEETAIWTCGRILEIRTLFEHTCELCREKLPSRVYSKELIEILFTQPYCKIKFLVENDIAKRETASKYLKEVEKIGVIKGIKIGKEMVYINNDLLDILQA